MSTSVNRDHNRVRVHLNLEEAALMAYALRHFATAMADADTKAQGWAKLMKRIADDISQAIHD